MNSLQFKRQQLDQAVKRVFSPRLVARTEKLAMPDQLLFRWQKVMKRLFPLGGTSEGNHLYLYNAGDEYFVDLWKNIQQAKQRVWLETFIFHPDAVGEKTLNLLSHAAARGLDVRLLYDYMGSYKLYPRHTKVLRDLGGKVVVFNPFSLWKPWSWHRDHTVRLHQKVAIIDSSLAYCGGMNVGVDYCGPSIGGTDYFRDSMVRVEGPAAKHLRRVFEHSWEEAHHLSEPRTLMNTLRHTLEQRHIESRQDSTASDSSDEQRGSFVQVLPSNSRRNARHVQRAMRITLAQAQRYCFISTPYFIPPLRLKHSLTMAAERGIEIRILTSGKTDVFMAPLAAKHIYYSFLRRGIRIFEMQNQALHAKTAVVDDIYASVGSFNMDTFSDSNLEVNLTCLDPSMAKRLHKQFLVDLEHSKEITLSDMADMSWMMRMVSWLAYQAVRLVSIRPRSI